MDLCAQKNYDNVFLHILMVRQIRLTAVRKVRSLFLEDPGSIGKNDVVVENKMGGEVWRW